MASSNHTPIGTLTQVFDVLVLAVDDELLTDGVESLSIRRDHGVFLKHCEYG